MLKIYNTLTKKKEPLLKQKIKIYTCGVTVYDHCHIGHARIFLFFDTILRFFEYLKIKTILIRNITDIDDKIIEKSILQKISLKKIIKKFKIEMHNDTKKLNIIEPSFEPTVTNFIKYIINLIKFLKEKKYAYQNKHHDIYYNIKKFKNYGNLSKKNIQQQQRTKKNINIINKKNEKDFTLWKKNEKNKYTWPSPWGNGRPGWHTECAAMSMYYDKKNIDIHGGGHDLLFPHHENELTQCESIIGEKFVKIWMHIGHLKIEKKKMSKSQNNHVLIKTMLKLFSEEDVRFFLLLTHYRKAIEYSISKIRNTKKALDKLYKIILNSPKKTSVNTEIKEKFIAALKDDFNTPKAISILFNTAHKIKNTSKTKIHTLIYTIKYLGNIIGILKHNPVDFLNKKKQHVNYKNSNKINILIQKRDKARKEKNWPLADKIRLILKNLEIKIEDKKQNNL